MRASHSEAVQPNDIMAIEKNNANFALRRGWARQDLAHDRAANQASVLAPLLILER